MSLTNPIATTALEAVNIMLGAIGESPVSDLSNDQIVDAVIAQKYLEEELKEVQGEGWHFNTEIRYPLAINGSGEIVLGPNVVSVDFNPHLYASIDVVQRGNRLYNRTDHTYTFTQTMYADMIILLPFDEMPECARRYVTLKAARLFINRMVGDVELDGFASRDEVRAKAVFLALETENADRSLFDGSDQISVLLRR